MPSQLLTPELESLKGREEFFQGKERIEVSSVRRYMQAIKAPDIPSAEEDISWENIHIPFTYLFDVSINIFEKTGPDGRSLGRFTIPGLHAIRGGNEYTLNRSPQIGDLVSLKRKIIDVYEKKGKSGPILFVEFEYTYSNQDGITLGVAHETMLYVKRG
jgi:hypothetical protein